MRLQVEGVREAKSKNSGDDFAALHAKSRSYFAVARFDSPVTAQHAYSECNATGFMHTSSPFDLRFVPKSLEFNLFQACFTSLVVVINCL
jgi:hypothetical protein